MSLGMRLGGFAALAMLLSMASPALAAPFCVETQALPQQCIYFDPASCQKEAVRQGGICSANAATPIRAAQGHYCMVLPGGYRDCNFVDRGSCMTNAVRAGGACIIPAPLHGKPAPDPYRNIRN